MASFLSVSIKSRYPFKGKPVLDQYGYPAYTGLVEYAIDDVRLMVDMTAEEELPALGGRTALYACHVWLMNEASKAVAAGGKMTITFRLPDAIGQTVTVWHRGADGQWTKILSAVNLTGEITLEVDSLGGFAFTLDQAAL